MSARRPHDSIPAPIGEVADLTVPVLVAPGTPPPTVPKVRHYTTAQAFAEAEAFRQAKVAEAIVEKAIAPLISRLNAIDDLKGKLMLVILSGLLGAFVMKALS